MWSWFPVWLIWLLVLKERGSVSSFKHSTNFRIRGFRSLKTSGNVFLDALKGFKILKQHFWWFANSILTKSTTFKMDFVMGFQWDFSVIFETPHSDPTPDPPSGPKNIFARNNQKTIQISETYPKMSFQLLLSVENDQFEVSLFFCQKKEIRKKPTFSL